MNPPVTSFITPARRNIYKDLLSKASELSCLDKIKNFLFPDKKEPDKEAIKMAILNALIADPAPPCPDETPGLTLNL